jgi:hypothetical protein
LVAVRVYGMNQQGGAEDTRDRRIPLYPENNSGNALVSWSVCCDRIAISPQATKLGSTGVARAHAKCVFVVPTDVEIVALAWLV